MMESKEADGGVGWGARNIERASPLQFRLLFTKEVGSVLKRSRRLIGI